MILGAVKVEATADLPMYDYDAHYRRLKTAGSQGWAGDQHERNFARAAATLERLERDHFPKPPARVLELGCGNASRRRTGWPALSHAEAGG